MATDGDLLHKKVGAKVGPLGGVPEAELQRCEAELGCPFPPSFRSFLSNYAFGQIRDEVIYGVDVRREGVPDILKVHAARKARRSRTLHEVVFCDGNEVCFVFDTSGPGGDGEYPVFIYDDGADRKFYAPNFTEFVRRRVRELLRE